MTRKDRVIYHRAAIMLCCVVLLAVHWVFWSMPVEMRTVLLTAASAAYAGYLIGGRSK